MFYMMCKHALLRPFIGAWPGPMGKAATNADRVKRGHGTKKYIRVLPYWMQAIGSQSLQALEPSRRDEYMRNVSSLEGLTSLAAAVSRTSIAMLSEVAILGVAILSLVPLSTKLACCKAMAAVLQKCAAAWLSAPL